VSGPGPNMDLLLYLNNTALQSIHGMSTYYSVQRRHPDGKCWIDVGHFPSRDVAKLMIQALVAHGQGSDAHFRVAKVTRKTD
jgi:hypothetical protein